MADERILLQDVEPGGEVLPHHKLAERELSERDVAGHAPAVHFRHGLGKGVEDLREIDAVVVFGNGIESLDGDVELGAFPHGRQHRNGHGQLQSAGEVHHQNGQGFGYVPSQQIGQGRAAQGVGHQLVR